MTEPSQIYNASRFSASRGLVRSVFLRRIICVLLVLVPWSVRRHIGAFFLGWQVAPTSRVGFSYIASQNLVMGDQARIGHLNVVLGIDGVHLGDHASIGNLNWICGTGSNSNRFPGQVRQPRLVMEPHSSMTGQHLVDCCDLVTIGEFTTLAGARTQILSHGIDILINRQQTAPVSIGRYCYVGTGSIILMGATLPDFCVLGAGSLLTKDFSETLRLYAGVPAKPVKTLSQESLFFRRERSFVD